MARELGVFVLTVVVGRLSGRLKVLRFGSRGRSHLPQVMLPALHGVVAMQSLDPLL
jgi:hypothetical protein